MHEQAENYKLVKRLNQSESQTIYHCITHGKCQLEDATLSSELKPWLHRN